MMCPRSRCQQVTGQELELKGHDITASTLLAGAEFTRIIRNGSGATEAERLLKCCKITEYVWMDIKEPSSSGCHELEVEGKVFTIHLLYLLNVELRGSQNRAPLFIGFPIHIFCSL